MKTNSTKQLPAPHKSSSLRLAYKNEEVINDSKRKTGKGRTASAAKVPNKLFVKEPLPLFNDYKFKARDHDPL